MIRALLILLCLTPFLHKAQDFALNGDVIGNSTDCYQMTNAVNDQISSIFTNDLIDLSEDFNFEFEMNFGSNPGGADGMVFVLQNYGTDFIGGSGGDIGYESSQSLVSFGVEFDTWENAEIGDPFFDHLAVISMTSTSHIVPSALSAPVQMSATDPNVEDGNDHLVAISWDSANQLLRVEFDCSERLTLNFDIVQNIFSGNSNVHWGFTASTGGANNIQNICIIQDLPGQFPTECVEEGNYGISAPGSSGDNFTWTPAVTSVSDNNQTVLVDVTETTDFIVMATDPCDGIVSTDTITIFVNNLEIDVSSDIIDCYSDSIQLFGQVNQSNDLIYSWTSNTSDILLGMDSINAIGQGEGLYTFEVLDSISNCSRSINYEAPTNFVEPFISGSSNGLLSCLSPEILLEATELSGLPNLAYSWITQGGNIVSTNENIISVSQAGSYEVTVTNLDNGCSEEISILAENDPDFLFDFNQIEVPNVITSNKDFVNDEFKAFLSTDPQFNLVGKMGTFELNVFNRWGNEVYSTNNVENSWAPDDESAGVYFYVFQYSDLCDLEDLFIKKGTVEILK